MADWTLLWAVIAAFALLLILLSVRSLHGGRTKKETFEWQPDLTHNVKYIDEGITGSGRYTKTVLVEKSQEQLDEERRAYLREKEK